MEQSLCDLMKPIWDDFHSDLVLEVHHILTEPTCPMAKITVERTGEVLAHNVGDTISQAVDLAVAKVRERYIIKDPCPPSSTSTAPDANAQKPSERQP